MIPESESEGYNPLYHEGIFYFLGGYANNEPSTQIAALDSASWTWSLAGELNVGRVGHSVIKVGNRFMVVGGWHDTENESCILANGIFSCELHGSSLKQYFAYPILILVEEEYENCY